jgi:hypothetical protein
LSIFLSLFDLKPVFASFFCRVGKAKRAHHGVGTARSAPLPTLRITDGES